MSRIYTLKLSQLYIIRFFLSVFFFCYIFFFYFFTSIFILSQFSFIRIAYVVLYGLMSVSNGLYTLGYHSFGKDYVVLYYCKAHPSLPQLICGKKTVCVCGGGNLYRLVDCSECRVSFSISFVRETDRIVIVRIVVTFL